LVEISVSQHCRIRVAGQVSAAEGGAVVKFLRLAALTLALGSIFYTGDRASASPQPDPSVVLTVSVFNDANVPADVVRHAESEAGTILRQAGVQIEWLDCGRALAQSSAPGRCGEASFPTHLHLRILNASRGLPLPAVGISFLSADGTGCYADLFYEPLVQLRTRSPAPVSVILGHAMAHELGHLLLGTNSHSSRGLMRERWDQQDLVRATGGELLFSAAQETLIRTRLIRAEGTALARTSD
jgi:hypothetical protein